MAAEWNSSLAWSVITLLSSVVAIGLLMSAVIYLSFKRLHGDLSETNQMLRLCASALHRIAGDNSTAEFLEREVNQWPMSGTADRK